MAHAVVILAVLLPLLMAACFLLGRHLQRRQFYQDELSPVSRQHIDLFQGGQLSEAAVESTKARFRELLERGEVEAVEASLRAGMQYVVQVLAEARLGEMIESLWDGRESPADPLAVRVYLEALRLLRRAPHAETMLAGESADQEAFGWQTSRLAALEPALVEYLAEAPAHLC